VGTSFAARPGRGCARTCPALGACTSPWSGGISLSPPATGPAPASTSAAGDIGADLESSQGPPAWGWHISPSFAGTRLSVLTQVRGEDRHQHGWELGLGVWVPLHLWPPPTPGSPHRFASHRRARSFADRGDAPCTGCQHAKLVFHHGELLAAPQQTLALHRMDYTVISGCRGCFVMLSVSVPPAPQNFTVCLWPWERSRQDGWVESSPAEKDLGIPVGGGWDTRQRKADVAPGA